MIYVLVGESCSGKTTILKRLIEFGYKPIVSYTTRPKRPTEIDGKDYNFVTNEEFEMLVSKNAIVAKNSFVSAYNTVWSYGINTNEININEDLVVITEPKGLKDLKNKFGNENVIGIYLKIPYVVRFVRGLNRRDRMDELLRRLAADEEDFKGFEQKADFVVTELELVSALTKVIKIIKGEAK